MNETEQLRRQLAEYRGRVNEHNQYELRKGGFVIDCPYCEGSISRSAAKCCHCGSSVASYLPDKPQPLWFTAMAFVLSALLVGLFIWSNMDRWPKPEPQEVTEKWVDVYGID